MIARPSALGVEVKIDGLPIADQVLHELAWIQNRMAEIDAQVKAKIDAAKEAAKASAVVAIGETSVTLTERADYLRELLQRWTLKHIDKHFEGKKRSVEMAHGKLGLRQIPMVAELAPAGDMRRLLIARVVDHDLAGSQRHDRRLSVSRRHGSRRGIDGALEGERRGDKHCDGSDHV